SDRGTDFLVTHLFTITSSPAAGAPAEDAEFGAVRVVERHRAARLGEGAAKLEARIVGEQSARKDDRMGCAFAFYHHAGGRAHHALRRFPEDTPARFSDLGDVGGGVHFREDRQRHRIIGIDRRVKLRKQSGKAAAEFYFRFAREAAAGD